MNTELLFQGLEVSVFGLAGVFGALIAFYLIIVFLGKIPSNNENENNQNEA